jgi:hypothetical protein
VTPIISERKGIYLTDGGKDDDERQAKKKEAPTKKSDGFCKGAYMTNKLSGN